MLAVFLMLASHFCHFFWGGGAIFEVRQNAVLETHIFCIFTVLPEDLNVLESFCIQQTETVSVNPVVGFCYNLEWVL